jgi:hypothetical protein
LNKEYEKIYLDISIYILQMAYIHPDNQTLLWNTIQKAPNFEKLGINKTQWFKSIIKEFYDHEGKTIRNQIDLQNINKSTIAYMVHALKQMSTSLPSTSGSAERMSSALPSTSGSAERMTQYNDEFNNRQKEYEMMNAKPLPPQMDQVNEKIADEAITNMDELIRQQLAQREQELKMFGQSPQQIQPSAVKLDNVPIEPTVEKKSVSWKNDIDRKEFDELREMLIQLKETVETLKKQINPEENKDYTI